MAADLEREPDLEFDPPSKIGGLLNFVGVYALAGLPRPVLLALLDKEKELLTSFWYFWF